MELAHVSVCTGCLVIRCVATWPCVRGISLSLLFSPSIFNIDSLRIYKLTVPFQVCVYMIQRGSGTYHPICGFAYGCVFDILKGQFWQVIWLRKRYHKVQGMMMRNGYSMDNLMNYDL